MQKKSIIELSITGVLILVLLSAVTSARRRAKLTKRLERTTPKELSQEEISIEEPRGEDKELFRKLEEETKNLELKRDPFASSPITPTERPIGLHLTGIAWDEENPRAIINDIILGIGDRVGGNTIVDITQDKVILNDGTQYFEIRLGQ